MNAKTIWIVVSLCFLAYFFALPVFSMQWDTFDFKLGAAIARDMESALNYRSPIKPAVFRIEVRDGKEKITLVQSSGDESIDSNVRSALELATSKKVFPPNQDFEANFSFGPRGEEDPRKPGFYNRVCFRPALNTLGQSPAYPSYYSDGKPDLIPYKLYLKRKVSHLSAISEIGRPVVIELIVSRSGSVQTKIHKSCGRPTDDKSALQAIMSTNYERLPEPGPTRIRCLLIFGRLSEVTRMDAEYE